MTDTTPKRRNRPRSPINPDTLTDAYDAVGYRLHGDDFDAVGYTIPARELSASSSQWRKVLSYLRMTEDTPQRKEAEAALVELRLSYTDGPNNSRTFHDIDAKV